MEVFGISENFILAAMGVVFGTGIAALIMIRLICHSNEMGEETGAFQDFVPGDVEIIREKDYRMNV